MNPLECAFARMGARVEFGQLTRRNRLSGRMVSEDLALDVRQDQHGEYFLISRAQASTTELVVLDVQPRDRHLLLLSRSAAEKHRFLLGHDERHWFVAGIPESTPVSRVRDAKQALKPDLVQTSERGVRTKYRDRRSNAARIRQGEWFFVPAPQVRVELLLVLRTSRSRVEEASPMSVKSYIALVGRRFMSAPARQIVSQTSNTGLSRRANGIAGIGVSCDATRECMCVAECAIRITRRSRWMAGTRFSVTQRISRTPCGMWLSWTRHQLVSPVVKEERYFAPNESTRRAAALPGIRVPGTGA
jgi:hypothetical protein